MTKSTQHHLSHTQMREILERGETIIDHREPQSRVIHGLGALPSEAEVAAGNAALTAETLARIDTQVDALLAQKRQLAGVTLPAPSAVGPPEDWGQAGSAMPAAGKARRGKEAAEGAEEGPESGQP